MEFSLILMVASLVGVLAYDKKHPVNNEEETNSVIDESKKAA